MPPVQVSEDQREIIDEFLTEGRESISEIESTLMELEQAGQTDSESLNTVFRTFHSMKGTAGFLGFQHVVAVTHKAESMLDKVRRGEMTLGPTQITVLCSALDFARQAMDDVDVNNTDANMAEAAEKLKPLLDAALLDEPAPAPEPEQASADADPDSADPFPDALEIAREHVRCVLEGDTSTQRLDRVITSFEMLKLCIEPEVAPPLAPLLNAATTLLGQLAAEPQQASFSLMGALRALEDQRNRELGRPLAPMIVAMPSLESSPTEPDPPVETLAKVEPETTSAKPIARSPAPSVTPDAPQTVKPTAAPLAKPVKASSIRVDVEKLDELMNLVGELIIAERMVTHNDDLIGQELEAFNKAALQLNRITRSLQDVAMSTRLLPVRALFRRMMRLVRDVAIKQEKLIHLELAGEGTEVDKSVIEGLADPLVHLLRNSCDHGIESPEDRVAAGKPKVGTVRLEARHQGGEVWIIIEDDGKGLHRDQILRKAVEKGLVQGDATRLKDHEVFALIFQPGFSTASQVTSISGRGVGMDVVKRNVEKLRGRVEIASKPGKGTRLTLRIPLTLAIVEGMLVRTGDMLCTIPLLAIRESVSGYKKSMTTLPDNSDVFQFRGQFISILDMRTFYKIDGDRPEDGGTLVVVEDGVRRIGLVVDELIGQRQTVIKGLPGLLGRPRGLSGCSILSNGDISLILDVSTLMEQAGL